ncbi:MAG TPA: hypothetical protein VG227_03170 [Caulobacteraceae bacterium]|nr:hypothetical protein [Caulobacteraceae bacterium]
MSIVEAPSPAQPLDLFTIRWIGYGLTALGTALPIFILFVSKVPAQLLTIAAIICQVVLLGLVERLPQAFLITLRNSTQQVENFILAIPVLALAMAGIGAHFVRPEIADLVAVGAAAVGMLVAVWMPRSSPVASPIVFGLFVGAYAAGLGWGAMTLVNRVFDSSPGQVFATVIQDKSMSWGGRGGPHYYLSLEPWGPVDRAEKIGVSGGAYYRASIGGTMCMKLHPGALAVAWYEVGSC